MPANGDPATLATLLGEAGDGGGRRIVSTWSRDGGPVGLSWVKGSVLARALEEDRAIVEVGEAAPLRIGYGAPTVAEAVAAPVRIRAEPAGAIFAGFAAGTDQRDPAEIGWIAEAFASVAALCLSERSALAATLRAARFDGLTGCLGSSALLDAIDAEIARSQRHDHGFACCFVDLDGFKAVNDEHGHLEGNRVLASVADALLSTARRYDLIGRFGGDEFVAILPQTELGDAYALANRMRERIADTIADAVGLEVTASIGVAEWLPGMSPRQIIDAADRALREERRERLANGSAAALRNGTDAIGQSLLGRVTRYLLRMGNDGADNGVSQRDGSDDQVGRPR